MNRAATFEDGSSGRPVQSVEVLLAVVVVERRDDVAPLTVLAWADFGEDWPGMTAVAPLDDRIDVGREQDVRFDD